MTTLRTADHQPDERRYAYGELSSACQPKPDAPAVEKRSEPGPAKIGMINHDATDDDTG
jgi:hypothetical protein